MTTGTAQPDRHRRTRLRRSVVGLEDQTAGHPASDCLPAGNTLWVCYLDTPNRRANGAADKP